MAKKMRYSELEILAENIFILADDGKGPDIIIKDICDELIDSGLVEIVD